MKKAIIILSLFAAAFAAFIVIFPDKNPLKKLFPPKAPNADPLVPNVPGVPNGTTTSQDYRLGFPLMKGSKGTYVMAIQAALNKKYFTNLEIDGIFGPKTYRALSVNGYNPDAVTFTDYQKLIS